MCHEGAIRAGGQLSHHHLRARIDDLHISASHGAAAGVHDAAANRARRATLAVNALTSQQQHHHDCYGKRTINDSHDTPPAMAPSRSAMLSNSNGI